jgi:intein/homing endonuclease
VSRPADSDGIETVTSWACVSDCPVAALDKQSGFLIGRGNKGPSTATSLGLVCYSKFTSRASGDEYNYDVGGGSSRFFLQIKGSQDMQDTIPSELVEYLRKLISPPGWAAYYCEDIARESFWEMVRESEANSHCGLIVRGTPTEEQAKELHRILKPGAHLLLIAPETEPIGHTGACRIEDAGLEIRDTILLATEGTGLHYVPKAARKERELGCDKLAGRSGAEAVKRQDGTAGLENPRAGAGRTAGRVNNFHPCLHPETLIMTDWGYKQIIEIKAGDKVYSADGRFHTVEQVSNHPYTSPELYSIAIQGSNLKVQASDNHPFLIWRPIRKNKKVLGGEVLWVEAQDLKKGDYTMTPLLQEMPTEESIKNYDLDFWYLFGLYLAEGVLQTSGHSKNVYPSFTLHEKELYLVDRLKKWFPNTKVYKKEGKGIQVISYFPEAGKAFRILGNHGASTKVLNPILWSLPITFRTAILEGHMAGDGGIVRTYKQSKTVSQKMASQLMLLAESLGYRVELNKELPTGRISKIRGRDIKSKLPAYQLRFYSRNQQLTHRKPSKPTHLEHAGICYLLHYLKNIEKIPYSGDVWNLSVEGSPTFQTAVGMTHNTVKPKDLMVKLLSDVPKDQGPVLDPFLGSGSTGIACIETGHDFLGIELNKEYLEIADARIRHWDRGAKEGAEIHSDLVAETKEKVEMDLDDLFGGSF